MTDRITPDVRPRRAGDPERLGAYEIIGLLGEGGQGAVFLGRHAAPSAGADRGEGQGEGQGEGRRLDGEFVAVKLLHAAWTTDRTARSRFIRELEVAKRVARFCTAQIIDADMAGDQPYIVSEYVPGPSLARLVATEGPRGGGALERLAVSTLTALAAIHHAGIVHRDFKPHNVLMGADGPRVIDFGVARALDAAGETQTVGTPAYMAPEHFTAGPVGPATDMFAWAVTMTFAANGRPAFGNDEMAAVMHRIIHADPDLGALSGPLREVVTACLAKDPELRPSARDAQELLLGEAAHGPRPTGDAGGWPQQAWMIPADALPADPFPEHGAAEPGAAEPGAVEPGVAEPGVAEQGRPEPEPEPGGHAPRDPVQAASSERVGEVTPVATGTAMSETAAGASRASRTSRSRGVPVVAAAVTGAVLLLVGGVVGATAMGGDDPVRRSADGGAAAPGTGASAGAAPSPGAAAGSGAHNPDAASPRSSAPAGAGGGVQAGPGGASAPTGDSEGSGGSGEAGAPGPGATTKAPGGGTGGGGGSGGGGGTGGGGTTEPAQPYTAPQVCGSGYYVQRSSAFSGGRTYQLYNTSTKKNCVVTLKTTKVGTATRVWAKLEVQGGGTATDDGSFKYYAGPVYLKAPGTCVRYSGGTATGRTSAGWANCG